MGLNGCHMPYHVAAYLWRICNNKRSVNTLLNVINMSHMIHAVSWGYRQALARLVIQIRTMHTVYPKKYAHGFCFAVLCCGYTLTDFPISIRLTSLALWQSNDCPSASKATLVNMDKYFMWIPYERLHNHNKAKHNKTVCIFLGIYCMLRNNFNHMTSENAWVRTQHCGYWCFIAIAPNHQCSQCWSNMHCDRHVS